MINNDRWIRQQAAQGMLRPFEPSLIRQIASAKVLSYGCSSYGYDIRLSPEDFRVFQHVPGTIMDPKAFNPANLRTVELQHDANGSFFVLPAHSYGLGVALEHLNVPKDVTIICLGKSTYARMGVIANMTPAEAGWRGHLTLEFSNSSGADCRLYANEGICQLLFFQGDPCEVSYECRAGKYQDQAHSVTLATV
ncbi:MAG: dCTP deaminase [Vulcanococcus sp.]